MFNAAFAMFWCACLVVFDFRHHSPSTADTFTMCLSRSGVRNSNGFSRALK